MSDLKPCPFCGEQPSSEVESNGLGVFWIICDNVNVGGCGCEGPYKPSEEEAAEAWNRREGAAAKDAELSLLSAQNEWLKDRLSDLQLPANSPKNIEEWLAECGMPTGENHGRA